MEDASNCKDVQPADGVKAFQSFFSKKAQRFNVGNYAITAEEPKKGKHYPPNGGLRGYKYLGIPEDGGILLIKIENRYTDVCFTTNVVHFSDKDGPISRVDISVSSADPLSRNIISNFDQMEEQGWFGWMSPYPKGALSFWVGQSSVRCEKVEFFKRGKIVEGYIIYKNEHEED